MTSYLYILFIFVSSLALTIELLVIYEFVIKPIYYYLRLQKITKKHGIIIPNQVKVYNVHYLYGLKRTSRGTYIVGAYYPELKRIDLFCGHKDPFQYYSTLFHELTHWTEDLVGRRGISLQNYRTALDNGNTVIQKFYFLNELIAEKSSEYLYKYYFPESKDKAIYRKRRNQIYISELKASGIRLSIQEYRYIVLEAKYSAEYIIKNSSKKLK